MQRAAWSRVASSESGMHELALMPTRRRPARSAGRALDSRKPVTLPMRLGSRARVSGRSFEEGGDLAHAQRVMVPGPRRGA